MLAMHRLLRTWDKVVDAYVVALTDFARQKLISGGLPADRLFTKPNFVIPDPDKGKHEGNFALFVGRLSPEKGIHTLLSAWSRLHGMKLKIGNFARVGQVSVQTLRHYDDLGLLIEQAHQQHDTVFFLQLYDFSGEAIEGSALDRDGLSDRERVLGPAQHAINLAGSKC